MPNFKALNHGRTSQQIITNKLTSDQTLESVVPCISYGQSELGLAMDKSVMSCSAWLHLNNPWPIISKLGHIPGLLLT